MRASYPSTARRSSLNADRTASRAALTTSAGASGENRVDHCTMVWSTSPCDKHRVLQGELTWRGSLCTHSQTQTQTQTDGQTDTDTAIALKSHRHAPQIQAQQSTRLGTAAHGPPET